MESKSDQSPLIVIVGQTASGKTALAMEVAQKWGGEIIAADSRTIYKGMDIGTAKPTLGERRAVPHHLVDIATPNKPLTAADFKEQAARTIADISSRGRLPIMVGGTGLYVDAVVFDYNFAQKADASKRTLLEKLDIDELQQQLANVHIPLPRNAKNKRHLIRQLETGGIIAAPHTLRPNTIMIGIEPNKEIMAERIAQRVDAMLADGLEKEVQSLVAQYDWSNRALQTIGYQEFRAYFEGTMPLEEVRAQIVQNTVQYAKRQRTWFKRNKDIHWICNTDEAIDLITTFLNK
jgi:tRNA dimethylallyltransferase